MTIVLTIWLLAVFYTAVWSAFRVWQRRDTIRSSRPSRYQRFSNSVSDVELPEASMAQRSPDRSLTPELSLPPKTLELPAELDAALTSDAVADLPIATSIPLSEVVNPLDTVKPPVEVNLVDAHDSLESASQDQLHSSHSTVLAEIAQLDQAESATTMGQLGQYLEHPDSIMRAALASVLGELAIKRQGQNIDQIMTMLNTLTTDTNLQVKTEAMAALGRIGTELGIVQSNAS